MNLNEPQNPQLNIGAVRRSCLFCQFYRNEEVGDSDFGAVYSDVATCQKYLDTDPETEEDIPNFDREIDRDCCKLDFWRVVEVDNILSEKLAEESDRSGKMDETYELFKKRYNYA
jgi:hypothetical protein